MINKDIIKNLIGCNSIYTHSKHIKKRFYDIFTTYLNDDDIYAKKNSRKQFESLKFLIMNQIIDPNQIIAGELMIYTCIRNFTGWEIEKERIEFLLAHTLAETIKNYRNSENCSVLLALSQSSSSYDDDYFDYIYNKLIVCDIDINNRGITSEGQIITFLHGIIRPSFEKYIKIELDAGQDIILCIEDTYRSNAHTLQYMLYFYRFSKDEKEIKSLINIIQICIEHGFDLSYKDKDSRYLINYISDYGFGNVTCIINQDNSVSNDHMTLREYLISKGSPIEFELNNFMTKSSDIMLADIYLTIPSVKLLYDNMYEKDPHKIRYILDELKRLKESGEDLSSSLENRIDKDNIYEIFCYHNGPWNNTIISVFLENESNN